MLLLLRFSVLHATFYVHFTSIFNRYVIDVQLSCLLSINAFTQVQRETPLAKAVNQTGVGQNRRRFLNLSSQYRSNYGKHEICYY